MRIQSYCIESFVLAHHHKATQAGYYLKVLHSYGPLIADSEHKLSDMASQTDCDTPNQTVQNRRYEAEYAWTDFKLAVQADAGDQNYRNDVFNTLWTKIPSFGKNPEMLACQRVQPYMLADICFFTSTRANAQCDASLSSLECVIERLISTFFVEFLYLISILRMLGRFTCCKYAL